MSTDRRSTRIALWAIQGILAALFLFAGGFKLAMPIAELSKASPLPAAFLKFIGLCEVLGALGLVLPGLLRIRVELTPLAAAGLVIIMTGAVIVTAVTQNVPASAFPLAVGVLAAVVAFGRRQPALRAH